MNLYLPLTLLGGAVVANAELDLYVREQFKTADGDDCDSCEDGNGCFSAKKAFFLQQSCFNRADDKSSVYDEVQDGVVCRQDFPTSCEAQGVEFSAEDVEDCKDSWMLGECTDSKRMTRLKSWCKEITEPEGEYTVPLVAFQDFRDLEDCGTADYINILLPDEGGVCAPLSFQVNGGKYITGSRQVSCNDNVYNAVTFESTDCTGDGRKSSVDDTSDQCPDSTDSGYTITNNCSAPTIYCKASKEFSGSDPSSGSSEDANMEGSAGGSGGISPAGTAENEGAIDTPGGFLVLAMSLLSLFA